MVTVEDVLRPTTIKELNAKEVVPEEENWKMYIHIFPNGKYYVGTTSRSFEDRWDEGRGYNGQRVMRNAINRYRWENIIHVKFATGLTRKEAMNMEMLLIAKLHSNDRRYGYNVTAGGEGARGYKRDEKTIEKLRNQKKCIPVVQYDLELRKVARYRSASEASRATGVASGEIRRCVSHYKGGTPFTGGFLWIAESEVDTFDFDGIKDALERYKQKLNMVICQLDEDLNIINTYNGYSEAAKATGVFASNIAKCCKDWKIGSGRLSTGGFVWIFLEDYKSIGKDTMFMMVRKINPPIFQYDRYGNFIKEHKNIDVAAEELGVGRFTIIAAISGRMRTCKNCILKLKKEETAPMKKYDSDKIVNQYTEDGKYVRTFLSAADAARAMGVWATSIHKAYSRHRTSCGFYWKVVDSVDDTTDLDVKSWRL